MPRRLRIHLDGVPLHIVQRGHNREPCFFGDDDYHAYLHWLREALKKERCALHAYALMTNHVHLLITPELSASVPRLIIALGRRYVQYINVTYHRTGTLWDSRYKSSLIQAETYLLNCQRYIELNPVRAAIVDDPAQYTWSSYRHHALGQDNPYLSPHPLYLALGKNDKARQAAYRNLFRTELDNEAISDIRLALQQNQPLGNSRFYAKIEATTGQRREPKQRGRPKGQQDEFLGNCEEQGELPL
jgi:putative transposase